MDIMHVGKFTFQLTPSRRATRDQRVSRTEGRFQLTPSRRATAFRIDSCIAVDISTHALTEGDGNIYCYIVFGLFQLTPSRRATLKERLVLVRQYYFNSRPHGGRELK